MSKSRLEWKVGLFVFIGLVLLAALLIAFSKGLTLFRSTYDIRLISENVGGLKPKANVTMSGVQIGTVARIKLAPDGRTVSITLRIYSEFNVHKDAKFVIDQSGFLGDQYISIIPMKNAEPAFSKVAPDVARAEAPFNLQEFTRHASGFITRIDETVKRLNDALEHVTEVVLDPNTLTNLSITIANLRQFSDQASTTLGKVDAVVDANAPSLVASSSNLVSFSQRMNQFAGGLGGVLDTNSADLHEVVKNLESTSENLKSLIEGVQAGKGLAGNLLKNEALASNVAQIANNLSITSSNLNRLGLWGILWQHKPPRTNMPSSQPLAAPKDPFEDLPR